MKLSTLAIAAVALVAFGLVVSSGVKAQERQECANWQHEATGRASWYSTDWQRSQCHAYGMVLPDEGKTVEGLAGVARDITPDIAEVICKTNKLDPATCQIEIK